MSYKENVGKLRKRISNIFRGGEVEFAYGHLLVLHNQEEPLLNAWSQFNFLPPELTQKLSLWKLYGEGA